MIDSQITWSCMHPRNLGSDKIVCAYVYPFMLADVKCLAYQGIYKLCFNLVVDIHVMIN